MLAFTVRKFVNNGCQIPNLDEDNYRIVHHTQETTWGALRGRVNIEAWHEENDDWQTLIVVNVQGWCEGYDNEFAKELGLLTGVNYSETGIMDALYYVHNPVKFFHKNGNLKRGFEQNLARRLTGRSKTSYQTSVMLDAYKTSSNYN